METPTLTIFQMINEEPINYQLRCSVSLPGNYVQVGHDAIPDVPDGGQRISITLFVQEADNGNAVVSFDNIPLGTYPYASEPWEMHVEILDEQGVRLAESVVNHTTNGILEQDDGTSKTKPLRFNNDTVSDEDRNKDPNPDEQHSNTLIRGKGELLEIISNFERTYDAGKDKHAIPKRSGDASYEAVFRIKDLPPARSPQKKESGAQEPKGKQTIRILFENQKGVIVSDSYHHISEFGNLEQDDQNTKSKQTNPDNEGIVQKNDGKVSSTPDSDRSILEQDDGTSKPKPLNLGDEDHPLG